MLNKLKLLVCILAFICVDVQAAVHIWRVSDNTQLLSAVASLKANPDNFWGGTIVLAPGTYNIASAIEFNGQNHVNIVGSGPETVIQQTRSADALVFINSSFSTVRDLTVRGNASASIGSGIVFKGSLGSCTVDNCIITDFACSGIRFEGSDTAGFSSNTVSRCRLWNNRTDQLYSYYNHDFNFFENQIETDNAISASGVVLDHSSAGTYSENKHSHNSVSLKLGPGSHYNRIEHNEFGYSRQNAIVIGSAQSYEISQFNIILGNTVNTSSLFNSGKYASIEAYYAQQTTFTNNNIFTADTRNALSRKLLELKDGCSAWIISSNIFQHSNTYPAITYSLASGHIVKENIILPLAGDVNIDGRVDFRDLAILMGSWLDRN